MLLADTGFGVSQFLPIIVADFQLSNDSCLAISQPEIHLHPPIQASFGNYLAHQIKRTEKQYIVETHSEYLLNRIRLLLVTGELKPEDVQVLYFENDGVKSVVHDVEFTTKGAIKGAPRVFFETYEMDVMDIAMNSIK
ncbi:AAA family ATPase [Spirosoma jeollabukense]